MTPATPEPAELQNRLRQQLILAQVRIMELEDVRDTLTPQVAELETLLRAAQSLADAKIAEADHHARVAAAAQAHGAGLEQQQARATAEIAELSRQLGALGTTHDSALRQLDAARVELEALRDRIAQLDRELSRMKQSASWRWTAWLRALGRRFGGGA